MWLGDQVYTWMSICLLSSCSYGAWGGLCTPMVHGYVYSSIKLLLKISCVLKVQRSMWMHSHCKLSYRIGISWWAMVSKFCWRYFGHRHFCYGDEWYRILGCTKSLQSEFCLAMVRSVITGWHCLSVWSSQFLTNSELWKIEAKIDDVPLWEKTPRKFDFT
jgi:hypothetical protein